MGRLRQLDAEQAVALTRWVKVLEPLMSADAPQPNGSAEPKEKPTEIEPAVEFDVGFTTEDDAKWLDEQYPIPFLPDGNKDAQLLKSANAAVEKRWAWIVEKKVFGWRGMTHGNLMRCSTWAATHHAQIEHLPSPFPCDDADDRAFLKPLLLPIIRMRLAQAADNYHDFVTETLRQKKRSTSMRDLPVVDSPRSSAPAPPPTT